MASRKTGKAQMNAAPTNTTATGDAMEAKVVALAEQLGWFLGTVRGKADGWLANPALHAEVTRIRDGAAELMEQVTRASASAKQTAASATTSARKVAANVGSTAKKAVATAGTAARKAVAKTTTPAPVVVTVKARSGGTVDAPGKKHRKPPPQEKVNKRMGEPVGKQMGQKQFQPGHGARRG